MRSVGDAHTLDPGDATARLVITSDETARRWLGEPDAVLVAVAKGDGPSDLGVQVFVTEPPQPAGG